jgi:glucokinase
VGDPRRFVVVSGLPGSGKTTLAHRLSPALGLAVIDKDDILERLCESHGAGTAETRRALSRRSDDVLRAEAMASGGAILVSFWHLPGMPADSGTPTDWLSGLSRLVVNVDCLCPADEAAQRYYRRARHPGHLDAERGLDEIRNDLEHLTTLGPIPRLPRLSIDTRTEPDLDALVARITNTPEPEPACSFCGAREPAELIRAGSRPFFICSSCVESPRIEVPARPGSLCAFCEQPFAGRIGPGRRSRRQVAVSRPNLLLCDDCLRMCVQILDEDRRARR